METSGLDAIVLKNPEDVLFATGFWPITGWTIFVMEQDGRSRVLIPESELEFLDQGSVSEVSVVPCENLGEVHDPYKHIRSFFAGLPLRDKSRVGVELSMEALATVHTGAELSFMGCKTLEILRNETGAELADFSNALHRLRLFKTEREIGKISTACKIASIGLQEGRESLTEGMSESELASRVEAAVSVNGVGYLGARLARGFAYVMSGENGSKANLPFNISSNRKIKRGESVLIELNVQADGYWADLTRTWFVGRPSDQLRAYYDAVCEANEKAASLVRDGTPAKELDSAARGVISAAGFGHLFNHRLGHGIGFRLHEPPSLHPASQDVIRKNMTFTIEPGVYGIGYGIRVEDVIAARQHGPERLSSFKAESP